jgi:hypothetical protein
VPGPPSTRWLLESLTDELLCHRRRPRHPERTTPSHWSLSSNAAPPSPVQATSTPRPRATPKAERLSAVTKLPPPCTKGFAPPALSLPCQCPCSPVFPPLAACKVFEAMPEPRAASIVPTKSSVLRSKGYFAWLDSFLLLWSVARWFSLTFSMPRTTGISAGDGR